MRYLTLAATALTIFTASAQALPQSCGEVRDSFSSTCTQGESIFSTMYWKCKTGAWIAYGICQVASRSVTDDMAAQLTTACQDPHSKGCETMLDQVVNKAAEDFAKEPDFNKQELLDEIKQDVEGAMAPISPKSPKSPSKK